MKSSASESGLNLIDLTYFRVPKGGRGMGPKNLTIFQPCIEKFHRLSNGQSTMSLPQLNQEILWNIMAQINFGAYTSIAYLYKGKTQASRNRERARKPPALCTNPRVSCFLHEFLSEKKSSNAQLMKLMKLVLEQ